MSQRRQSGTTSRPSRFRKPMTWLATCIAGFVHTRIREVEAAAAIGADKVAPRLKGLVALAALATHLRPRANSITSPRSKR